jgi:ATP-binding cassette, subfamily B, multidrug efflux pump
MLKMLKYLKPYKVSVIILMVLTFLQILSQLYLPALMADIVNKGVIGGDLSFVGKTGLVMLGFTLIVTICMMLARLYAAKTAVGFAKDLRRDIFTSVEAFSLHEFDQIGTSSLITRSTNDVTQIQNVMVMLLTMFIMAPLTAIGGVIMALRTDVSLSWIILVAIAVLGTVIGVVASKGIPLFKLFQTKLDKINLVLRESLTGIRIIRAFNREKHEDSRFDEANEDLMNNSIKVYRIMSVFMPAIMVIMNITTISIIWFGSKRVDMATLQIGDMMAFQQYAMQIMFSLIMAAMLIVMIPRASASSERIFEILNMKHEIIDPENPVTADENKGTVAFNDVSFIYEGAENPVLRNISFIAKPGQTTAIIGSTGSGKTTLVNLIPRFYDATSGKVIVDGMDVKRQLRADLRGKIGFVPQKINLFTGSIKENVMFGLADATDGQVIEALETAQAQEFVTELEDGMDAHVEQGGANYSGGQRQRISIARALIRKPEVYIFDDSFSALDFKTDAKLRAALKKDTKNATVFIVAQRVSTVRHADQIIVLDQGEIVGLGKHDKLIKSCDVYKEIVSSQLSQEELS